MDSTTISERVEGSRRTRTSALACLVRKCRRFGERIKKAPGSERESQGGGGLRATLPGAKLLFNEASGRPCPHCHMVLERSCSTSIAIRGVA